MTEKYQTTRDDRKVPNYESQNYDDGIYFSDFYKWIFHLLMTEKYQSTRDDRKVPNYESQYYDDGIYFSDFYKWIFIY